MSGILDSKSRMIDAILTAEGRRQMAEGTFVVSYATFTDSEVAYEPDASNGHVDPTNRIYFEACNLPQDQITFEANDSGKIKPLRNQDISVSSPVGFLGTNAQANLNEGRLTAYQSYNGRRIKAPTIKGTGTDLNKGFVYGDSTSLTASILINPTTKAGAISGSYSPPYFAVIGTKGGLTGRELAIAISGAISSIANNGGPAVFPTVAEDSVYLDIGQTFSNTILFETGTLSTPLVLEKSQIGSKIIVGEVQAASFATQIQGILTSSFDNFLELRTIATTSRFFEDQEFELSTNNISFEISDIQDRISLASADYPPSVNEIDSIFNDDKMSHLDNFLYLPPIIKTSDTIAPDKTDIVNLQTQARTLGEYPSWGDNEKKLTLSKIKSQISSFGSLGRDIVLTKSSINNNIIGQFFEVSSDSSVGKLDVVEFGYVYNELKKTQEKIYFVGKVYLDNRGTTCFVNMFTLVFSSEEGGL